MLVHFPNGVHNSSQGSKTDGSKQGYKNPPVPRWLVGQSHILPNLPPAYLNLISSLPGIRFDSKHEELRTGTQADLQFHMLPVRLMRGQGRTHIGTVAGLKLKSSGASQQTSLSDQAGNVTHRPVNSYREATPLMLAPYETHGTCQKHWNTPESLKKVIPIPRSFHPHLR